MDLYVSNFLEVDMDEDLHFFIGDLHVSNLVLKLHDVYPKCEHKHEMCVMVGLGTCDPLVCIVVIVS